MQSQWRFLLSIFVLFVGVLPCRTQFALAGSSGSQSSLQTISFEQDVTIGNHPGDVVIGFITSACVDSAGNIFATDLRMQCVYKFNDRGQHLETFGTPGEGPGDLMFGVVMAMDSRSRMYMTGMGGRVQIMDTNWNYLEEFSRENPDNIARSIAVSPAGKVFISAISVLEQTAFDAYDSNFDYLGSFSSTFGLDKDVDWRAESLFAGGYLAVSAKEKVYYVQMTPYEVRKFTEELELETSSTIGGGDFVPPPPKVDFSGNTVRSKIDGAASGIVVLDSGDVVVSSYKKESQGKSSSLVVIYDKDLNFLAQEKLEGIFSIAGRDKSDRVFFSVSDNNNPRLIRAKLKY